MKTYKNRGGKIIYYLQNEYLENGRWLPQLHSQITNRRGRPAVWEAVGVIGYFRSRGRVAVVGSQGTAGRHRRQRLLEHKN